jgi:hypothetical protein
MPLQRGYSYFAEDLTEQMNATGAYLLIRTSTVFQQPEENTLTVVYARDRGLAAEPSCI